MPDDPMHERNDDTPDRLDEVDEAIDRARERVERDEDKPRFIDRGTVETDKIDNTIAPPG